MKLQPYNKGKRNHNTHTQIKGTILEKYCNLTGFPLSSFIKCKLTPPPRLAIFRFIQITAVKCVHREDILSNNKIRVGDVIQMFLDWPQTLLHVIYRHVYGLGR